MTFFSREREKEKKRKSLWKEEIKWKYISSSAFTLEKLKGRIARMKNKHDWKKNPFFKRTRSFQSFFPQGKIKSYRFEKLCSKTFDRRSSFSWKKDLEGMILE